ncbi:MAG: hypothetical protein ACYTA5_18020 [Planctomycetota bacterium]|jgi:Xaa-Pro aminopeptidase
MQTRQQEYEQKHEAVVRYMDAHELEAVILTRRCNFAWYTCGGQNHVGTCVDVGASSLLITRQKAVCITNVIEGPRVADEELAEIGMGVQAFSWHDGGHVESRWSINLGNSKAACDVRVAGLPEGMVQLGPDFDRLRWSLTEGEIGRYRVLGPQVAGCLEAACLEARPGMSEHQLGGKIANLLLERGIRAPVILVAADERVSLYRHPLPTGKKFSEYGMAVCCGEREGLIVSNTRLFSFKPIGEDDRVKPWVR